MLCIYCNQSVKKIDREGVCKKCKNKDDEEKGGNGDNAFIECSSCGRNIYDDDVCYVEDNALCENCACWCDNCEEYHYNEDVGSCNSCGNSVCYENMYECDKCGEYFCGDCIIEDSDHNYCSRCYKNIKGEKKCKG